MIIGLSGIIWNLSGMKFRKLFPIHGLSSERKNLKCVKRLSEILPMADCRS